MGWRDNLEAQGRGAAQTLTGGLNDEIVAGLLKYAPFDDETGIPREYAGGQYEQYRDQQRADEAESQAKHPANFATGQILGAVPGVVGGLAAAAPVAAGVGAARTLPALAGALSKGLPAVGLGVGTGAVHGFGTSSNKGQELLKDTVRGAALGGATAAGGNAVAAAAPALAKLWQGGPPTGGLSPALAGARAPGAAPRPAPRPQLNISEGATSVRPVAPSPAGVSVPPPAPRAAIPPPKPTAPTSMAPGSLEAEEEKIMSLLRQFEPPKVPKGSEPTYRPPKRPKVEAPVAAGAPETNLSPTTQEAVAGSPSGASVKPMDDEARAKLSLFDGSEPLGMKEWKAAPVTAKDRAIAKAREMLSKMLPESFLGKGWGREVYDDNGTALKIARGPEGIAQNLAERKHQGRSPVLNKVIDSSDDGSWIRQELVQGLDDDSLAKHAGMREITDPTDNWLRQMAEPNFHGPQPTAEAQELQERIRQVLSDVPELDHRDIGKGSQWALDKTGKPVLVDYGFLKGMPLGFAGLGAAAAANKQQR